MPTSARPARPATTSIVRSIDLSGRVPVWDLPTRLFHWSLVALIAFSWWSAEEGPIEWHMWSGYAILTLLAFRLLWGLFGSSTARFANFVRGPRTVFGYLRDIRSWKGIGHSPLGALSVIALLLVLAVQVATGLIQIEDDGLVEGPLAHLVSFETAEAAHDIHETSFNVLLVLIGLHVAALIFYRLVLGKRLVGPMVTGKAVLPEGIQPMQPGRGWIAILCLIAALAATRWIIAGAPPF